MSSCSGCSTSGGVPDPERRDRADPEGRVGLLVHRAARASGSLRTISDLHTGTQPVHAVRVAGPIRARRGGSPVPVRCVGEPCHRRGAGGRPPPPTATKSRVARVDGQREHIFGGLRVQPAPDRVSATRCGRGARETAPHATTSGTKLRPSNNKQVGVAFRLKPVAPDGKAVVDFDQRRSTVAQHADVEGEGVDVGEDLDALIDNLA